MILVANQVYLFDFIPYATDFINFDLYDRTSSRPVQ